MPKLHPIVQAILGGLAAALAVASPLVDDGVSASEYIAIASAFLTGTGLTAVRPSSKTDEQVPENDPAYS